ncbi:hypothetical protein [Prochlorococcus sp. MIT 1223]|uniref:hypothetical protein n=1 Tax=Prochlorococcus sp. MIT 1223 TaxID=3096217 RepID=UPI002A75FC8F|nr:hypothetical protein [Prochlorococcus sp. MIT 1223]
MSYSKRFKNYCEFERECVDFIKSFTQSSLLLFKDWNNIDLIPAIERHLYISFLTNPTLFYILLDSLSKEKFDYEDNSLKTYLKYKYNIFNKFSLLRKLKDEIKFDNLNDLELYVNKHKYMVIVHHPKFVYYLIESGFKDKNILWVVLNQNKKIRKILGKKETVISLPKGLDSNIYHPLIDPIINLSSKIYSLLSIIKPRYIICVEGDAPYHSAIAAISKVNNIKSICIQWGIFYPNKIDIGFSNMKFDYFLAWGKYFADQLTPLNKSLDIRLFGYPNQKFMSHQYKKSNKIIFLSQPPIDHITQQNFDDYIFIMRELSIRLKDFEIVYRSHPSFISSEIENSLRDSRITLDHEDNLFHHLSDSIISVGILTSALLESVLLDSIPISFNPTCLRHSIDFNQMGIGISVSNKTDAINKICNLAEDSSLMDSYRSKILNVKKDLFEFNQKKTIMDFIESI